MDEVHMLKNLKAQRTQALVSYWDAKARVMVPGIVDSIPNVLPMSGTPMLNRPNELFSILRALGSPMGKSKSKFEERYCDGKFITVDRTGRQVWSNTGSSNSGELASNVAPFFRKVFKADVLNLPPKVRTSIPVEISKADRKMFDRLFTDLENASATDDNDEPTGEILRLIGILKHETARVKVASTIEQAETIVQAGEKVIIFTCYTDTLEQIAAHFGSKAVVVDGSVTGPKRMTAVDAFQNNPEIRVFVGNVKAAGVAITLTAASYVIFNDRDWTPAMIFQAEDRAYRIGQTEMVNIYHMTAEGTFDEELVSALSGKSTLISGWEQAAIDGSEQAQVEPANIKAALFTYISNRKKSA
jgi:SNF2 family DNA or RNA helicase